MSFLLVFCQIFFSCPAFAVAIRTTMGEVKLDNFPLGEEINVRELSNQYYKVMHTGGSPHNIELLVGPCSLKEGYDPIPNAQWIRLSNTYTLLTVGEEMVSDIMISIPAEEAHLNKHYQACLTARAQPAQPDESAQVRIGVSLTTRILIDTAVNFLTRGQRKRIQEIRSTLGFRMAPDSLEVLEVPLGQKVELKTLTKRSFKLINPNDEDLPFKFTKINPVWAYVQTPAGYETLPPETSYVVIEPTETVVAASTIEEVKIYFNFPNDKTLAGKKYFLAFQAQYQHPEVPVSYTAKLLVKIKE